MVGSVPASAVVPRLSEACSPPAGILPGNCGKSSLLCGAHEVLAGSPHGSHTQFHDTAHTNICFSYCYHTSQQNDTHHKILRTKWNYDQYTE